MEPDIGPTWRSRLGLFRPGSKARTIRRSSCRSPRPDRREAARAPGGRSHRTEDPLARSEPTVHDRGRGRLIEQHRSRLRRRALVLNLLDRLSLLPTVTIFVDHIWTTPTLQRAVSAGFRRSIDLRSGTTKAPLTRGFWLPQRDRGDRTRTCNLRFWRPRRNGSVKGSARFTASRSRYRRSQLARASWKSASRTLKLLESQPQKSREEASEATRSRGPPRDNVLARLPGVTQSVHRGVPVSGNHRRRADDVGSWRLPCFS